MCMCVARSHVSREDKLLKRGATIQELWPDLQVLLITSTNSEAKEAFGALPVHSPPLNPTFSIDLGPEVSSFEALHLLRRPPWSESLPGGALRQLDVPARSLAAPSHVLPILLIYTMHVYLVTFIWALEAYWTIC